MAALDSAPEVWTYLVEHGGLQPDGWDAALVEDLRKGLGLGPGPVAVELAAAAVSTEAVVHWLLAATAPFAAMMADLLALFKRHGVRCSDNSASIVFDFDAPGRPPLEFDLESFRSALREWSYAVAVGLDAGWLERNAWELHGLLREASTGGDWQAAPTGMVDPTAVYERGEWPEPPLDVPASGSPELDVELGRVGEIWNAVVEVMRERAPNREALRNAAGEGKDAVTQLLWWLESDFFARSLAYWAAAAAAAEMRTRDPTALAAELRELLDTEPFAGEPVRRLVQRLQDIVDLPIWRQRHELYAAWLLAAAPAAGRLVTPEPGVLRFPFKATLMAELLGCRAEVWSELRTPLSDPVGVSRTGNIQPDYSVVTDAAASPPEPEASVLEIECKQYKRAATGPFAAALRDYAAGRPNALVVLVSHGPLDRDGLRAAVPDDVRARTDAIAYLHPGNADARKRFAEIVESRLDPLCPHPVMHCRLEWDRPPRDLDIHLHLVGRDVTHHVDYGSRGSLDAPPFAELSEDRREPGSAEELTIGEWTDGAAYTLAVHAFSDDADLGASGARMTLTVDGDPTYALECPATGPGRWWLVAELDRGSGLRLRNELRTNAPWAG